MSSRAERTRRVNEYLPRASRLVAVVQSKGPDALNDLPYAMFALESLQAWGKYFAGENIDMFDVTQRLRLKYEGHASLPVEVDACSQPKTTFEVLRGRDQAELILERQFVEHTGRELTEDEYDQMRDAVKEPELFTLALVERFERKYS
ncbi:hypothetical protein HN592_01920 [Candidatus Woesearchaeota archaeon]|jgi:hypothetical protein|nr:hypothetical protein [Candidatus Woesearchaeota archaeon]MBT4367969.1 hypothetical protein [Candidatus Woesearchaeota archaeon]MBT4712457.1 hypothetical protein [Candidatus Woesearchaeota archaeon]MBT6639370.1 hypothetical protein [Candidatus Woesearchaeota archaeon]MBT7133542.1 hypothetical protein [Candidatus Woesearchaeota archaeon]